MSEKETLQSLGEFGLIRRLGARLQQRSGTRSLIGDDCAQLDALSHPIVTTDALVENVHFRRDWITKHSSPRALGRKAMNVNVSDLAASGAHPVAAFVTLILPPDEDVSFLEQLYDGFEDAARNCSFTVAGGDTTRGPVLMISITLVGDLMPEAQEKTVTRAGAKIGDILCVTGTLGDSATALDALLNETDAPPELLTRHFDPTPRLSEMRAILAKNRAAVHAAMDLSDGLIGDAAHLARESNVGMVIHAEKLPISDTVRSFAAQKAVEHALLGGEDYELLLSMAPDADLSELTIIGEVVEGAGVQIRRDGQNLDLSGGWQHF